MITKTVYCTHGSIASVERNTSKHRICFSTENLQKEILLSFCQQILISLFYHKEAKNDNEDHLPHVSFSSVIRDIHTNLFFSAENWQNESLDILSASFNFSVL